MTETLNVKHEQYIVVVTWLFVSFKLFNRSTSRSTVDLQTSNIWPKELVLNIYVKNQLFRSYISCLHCSALRLNYSTATFNMTRVAYNNVYRALMGITRGYGHNISGKFCINNIDGLGAVLRKMISSLRGRLHKSVNTVLASYVSSRYFMLSSPLCAKWNMETLILWENVI